MIKDERYIKCNINKPFFFCDSSAGIWAGAVWTRERRTAGIRQLCPAADRRSLPGHTGAGGQRSGGVLLTGPHRTAPRKPSPASSPLPASPSLSSAVFHFISQDARTQTLSPSPSCTIQRTDTYGRDWQLASQVHAWIGFGVWEWWAFLLPSPTTTFILSAPSESCLHSHKHG